MRITLQIPKHLANFPSVLGQINQAASGIFISSLAIA